jgi:hypothetical protein
VLRAIAKSTIMYVIDLSYLKPLVSIIFWTGVAVYTAVVASWEILYNFVRFEVFTAVTVKNVVFWGDVVWLL